MRVAGSDLEVDEIVAGEVAIGDVVAGGPLGCVSGRVISAESDGQHIELELEVTASRPTRKVSVSAEQTLVRFSISEGP